MLHSIDQQQHIDCEFIEGIDPDLAAGGGGALDFGAGAQSVNWHCELHFEM